MGRRYDVPTVRIRRLYRIYVNKHSTANGSRRLSECSVSFCILHVENSLSATRLSSGSQWYLAYHLLNEHVLRVLGSFNGDCTVKFYTCLARLL